MRLLIITQKIDQSDDILGFMHGWVAEFAAQWEKVTVIALGVGKYDLPANVKVLSLGKESLGFGICNLGFLKKLKFTFNFFKYIWQERNNYDAVFVHMNQEYVLLAGLLWRCWGKKVALWRNHPLGGFWARIAVFVSPIVFCTSRFAFVARFKKTKIMPVGVNTDFFKPETDAERKSRSILFFSRISPIKKLDVLIEALVLLKKEQIDFFAGIIGNAPERDQAYLERMKQKIGEQDLRGLVVMSEGVPNSQAPIIFNQYELFINVTPTGSFDKTILEAMACGALVLMSNRTLAGEIDDRLFFDGTPEDLAAKIKNILNLSVEEKQRLAESLRNFVIKNHNLRILADKICYILGGETRN